MIEQIAGKLITKSPTFCVIDCHGIGIGLHITLNSYQYIGEEESSVQLLTYLHVREDALQLFGFTDETERDAFIKLIGVSGIGPRLALTILSGLTVDEFTQALATENHEALTRIPGVGKKTAQRVVLELKEKFDLIPESVEKGIHPMVDQEKEIYGEAVSALVTLGYKQYDAKRAVEKIVRQAGDNLAVEEIIKYALKEI